ncbi:hypothetical protein [Kingella denitrificans]|uniref:hypothetical protein n=1 Tax=Kingella denitrificans TaxID=502 RepID=UPI000B98931B|nr:hypothetical protein [Kingella denitrificans]
METEANKKKWVLHCTNLNIYTTFVSWVCERVVKNRMDGKTDREALGRLVAAIIVHGHWQAQALMLEDALPELGGDLRELAGPWLENYHQADDVLRETIKLVADELPHGNIVYGATVH